MNRILHYSLLLLLLNNMGCDGRSTKTTASNSSTTAKDKVVLMLNWYPEAEHGGFYAAKVHGIYDRYGLDVEIRPGGPNGQGPVSIQIRSRPSDS